MVTGIRSGHSYKDIAEELALQWGPVVVTGISPTPAAGWSASGCFNGVRSW